MKCCEQYAAALSAFVDGELSENEKEEVLSHVEHCQNCREYLSELMIVHTMFEEMPELDAPEGFSERVLERVMETFYARLEAGDAEGELLAETLGAGRDDRALTALVLEEHSKIQSHPYPLAWLEQVYAQWEQTPQALADCAYGRILMTDTCRKADFWARRLLQAAEEMADCPALEKGYAAGFRDAAAQLAHLRESAADGWDAMGAAVPKFPSLRPVRGEEERKVRARRSGTAARRR